MFTILHGRSLFIVLAFALAANVQAQIDSYPFRESFDGTSTIPEGWRASGFAVSTTSARSIPSCVATTGNQTVKVLDSPPFAFHSHRPGILTFWERRSSTALPFRLVITAVTNSDTISLARFDTSSSSSAYVQRTVSLAEQGLEHYDSVRIRWMLLGDNTSSSGVLRIDDIVLTAVSNYGISIRSIVIDPASPTRCDSIRVRAMIVNNGLSAVGGLTTDWFISPSAEQVFNMSFRTDHHSASIAPGDSIVQTLELPNLEPGLQWLGLRCRLDEDANVSDTLSRSIRVGFSIRDLVVTEFMYAPLNDEPEWIEIYNPSPFPIDLNSWTVSDNSAKARIPLADRTTVLAPSSFAILTRDASVAALYTIDTSVPILAVPFPSLNNTTADAVVLRDPGERTIDSVSYDPGRYPATGRSLERIDFQKQGTDTTNWSPPADSVRATPGRTNSVARMDHDLAVRSMTFERSFMAIRVVVHNAGRMSAAGFRLSIALVRSGGTERFLPEYTASAPLPPDDSIAVTIVPDSIPPGRTVIRAVMDSEDDQRMANNIRTDTIDSQYSAGSLIVNEIMYDPKDGSCEWIELQNTTQERIVLDDWTMTDAPTASGGMNVVPLRGSVDAGARIVVAADSTFFHAFPSVFESSVAVRGSSGLGLNNDIDAIIVRDATGSIIDSLWYTEDMHHPDVAITRGRSLERIHADIPSIDTRNWSTCVDPSGGTPGRANSISAHGMDALHGTVAATPNPFSPDGDGYEDHTLVQYVLEVPSSFVTVRIFDLRGRLVRTLTQLELVGPSGAVIWDGRDDQRRTLSPGGYVMLFESSHSSNEQPFRTKLLIAIAKRF